MRFRMVHNIRRTGWRYCVDLERKTLFGWRQVSEHVSDISLALCIERATERMESECKDFVLFDTKYPSNDLRQLP